MHVEVSVALNFVISYLYNKLPRRRVDMFGHELEKRMKNKFNGHWYPDRPTKGSAYRCIRVNGEKIDSDIEKAAFESGLDIGEIKTYLPADLTLWIDPSEVSYRITEKGSIKILYSDKKDDDAVDNIDREVQAVSKSFNPEAQCFKPIDSLSSSLSSLSLSPSSPTSPAGWSNTTSPSSSLFNSSTLTTSVPNANQNLAATPSSSNTSSSSSQPSGIANTVLVVPVPTTGAPSSLLTPSHSSTIVGPQNNNSNSSNNVSSAPTTPGTAATSPTVSSSTANASNGAPPTPGPGSTAPVVVNQSATFLNKPSHTSPQFTASTFAQTKFGSTKLKSQVKRPTRLSPIEFRNYFRQRAAGSSLQSSPVTPTGGSLIGVGNAVSVPAVGVPSTVGNHGGMRVGVGFGHPTTVVNPVPSPVAPGARPRSLSPRDPRLEYLFDHHHHQQHPHHRYISTMNGQKPIIATNSTLLPQHNHQISPQSQQQQHLSQSFLQAQQQIPSPQSQAQQQQQQQQQQAPLPSSSHTGMTLRDFYQSNQGPASPFNAPTGPMPSAAASAHTNLTFTDFLPNAMSNHPNNIQSESQKSFIEALSNLGTTAYGNQCHHLLVAN